MSDSNFRSEERNNALVIFMPSSLSSEIVEELSKSVKMWQMKNPVLHILNFEGVTFCDRSFFKIIIEYKKGLEKVGKFMASINMSPVVRREINANGLSGIFNPVSNMNDAYKLAGIKVEKPTKIKLDTNFINPFIEATIFTFNAQIGIEIKAGKPMIKKDHMSNQNINIAGVINLTCKHFTGSIAIAFSQEVFLKIYETMLGEKHDVINDEVRDAAGEILNIIYGQAKKELNRVGYELEKAIPTILSGNGIDIHHGLGLPAIVLPFESDAGEFFLEVSVQE